MGFISGLIGKFNDFAWKHHKVFGAGMVGTGIGAAIYGAGLISGGAPAIGGATAALGAVDSLMGLGSFFEPGPPHADKCAPKAALAQRPLDADTNRSHCVDKMWR